jgi:DNA helicase-2/ATP-dependent DNA helicase PcrA
MSLNPAQRAAVETLRGPMLVLAGAGTGKTRVVTFRIVRLIQSGIKPSRILAVTFTNKAAKEMQSRITELLKDTKGLSRRERPETSTFHSLCVRILHRHITKLGYPEHFAIYDRGDQESAARQVLNDIKISEAALKPAELISQISTWKNAAVSPEEAMKKTSAAKEYLAARCYLRYQDVLKSLGAVDFDDLLLLTEELFRKFPDVLQKESQRFDHILVDEYQDTNMSQYRIVKGLALQHRNLCVVGDDDQAIYGWRGAEVRHILNFQKDWADAKVIRLVENYRSTKQILDWANRIIVFNKYRHSKSLVSMLSGEPPRIVQCKDGETEAKTVVEQIHKRINTGNRKPSDFAVLFRTNEQPRAFEMEFRRLGLPYTLVGGQSFFDRKEVRDIMSFLKTFSRPKDDVALLRVLNIPPRGIGTTTVQKLTETAVSQHISFWELLKKMTSDDYSNFELLKQEKEETFGRKTVDALHSFRTLIEEQRNTLFKEFSVQNLKEFLSAVDYEKEINRQYHDLQERKSRWDSVGEVFDAAAAYIRDAGEDGEQPSLWEFVNRTSLDGPDFGTSAKKGLGQNAVTLMTLHAAKGLEFPEVYIAGLEEGILPHRRSVDDDNVLAVDEERRLCYVGITRARQRLTLTMALQRSKWGKMRPTIPSRFLYEITGQAENPNYKRAVAGETPKRTH